MFSVYVLFSIYVEIHPTRARHPADIVSIRLNMPDSTNAVCQKRKRKKEQLKKKKEKEKFIAGENLFFTEFNSSIVSNSTGIFSSGFLR